VLSREEINRLEDAATDERDKLIIRLLGDTGLRLGELLSLRIRDLLEETRRRFLRVRGKEAKERKVPCPVPLYQRVLTYATRGRPRDTNSEYIFLTSRRSAHSHATSA
jgi:integrase